MISINSSERFPIVRKLSDPSDAGTYYVRAVVRNSITGATIGTVNLDNDGLSIQRFVGTFVAPTDASGQGLWIDVVTKVYSDSGYTTQDTVYSDEVESYLVAQRWNYNLGHDFAGGPVGPDIDYKRIKKIVEEVIGIPKEVDLSPINNKLDLIDAKIKPVEFPESDYSSIISAIAEVKNSIATLPGPDKVNFAPVISRLDEIKSDIDSREMEKDEAMGEKEREGSEYREKSMEEKKKMHSELKDEIAKLSKRMEQIASVVENKEFVVKLNLPPQSNKEEKPNKLSDLMKRLR